MPNEEERLKVLRTIPGLKDESDATLLMVLRFANEMAGWYQQPVWVCGSALEKTDPRDIDLRINLPDADFALRYAGAMSAEMVVKKWTEQGLTGAWTQIRWRWSADCVKRVMRAWKLTNINIDFQVYPQSWVLEMYGSKSHVRIDEMPLIVAQSQWPETHGAFAGLRVGLGSEGIG